MRTVLFVLLALMTATLCIGAASEEIRQSAGFEYVVLDNGDAELIRYLEEEDEPMREYTEEETAMIEAYNRVMVDDRNLGMLDKAVEYLASGQTVFFAVGAAHMANDIGLVQLLTDAGYTVCNDGSLLTCTGSKTGGLEWAVDNIIVKGLKVSDFRKIPTGLSDHVAVVATLTPVS